VKLSVIVPVFNESQYLPRILNKVVVALPGVQKEIIIVDDCSTDGTREWLRESLGSEVWSAVYGDDGTVQIQGNVAEHTAASMRAIFHERNQGKGAAVRTGLRAATGDVLVIQDADLEYDPADWARFWPLFAAGVADVVYGSRFYGSPHRCLYYHHYLANKLISFVFSVLYNQILTDLEVCYKMFTRDVLKCLTLRADDFGFEIEFSSNVARGQRFRVYEAGVTYYGRTYKEGKKINWKDGVRAFFYLFLYRFV